MLSKKDIIEINKTFHTGKLSNESSLDFALSHVYRSKNWLKTAAILSRAILIDHVFEDGNKRTAAGTIMTIMEMNKIAFSPAKIDNLVIDITKKNISKIRDVEKVIVRGRE
jgi:prophage maintenance system killer protein